MVLNEVPTGAIDGNNREFELANAPNPASSLLLFHNGQLLKVGSDHDYVLNGKVITFNVDIMPQPDDVIVAMYYYTTPTSSYTFNERVVLTSTGGITQGVLDHEPNPPNSLMLFYNGQLLTAGGTNDYILAGKNVEIIGTSYQQDDVCLATYTYV
jgi:hypothetical protein